MRPAVVSGCSSGGMAIGSWAVPIVFPHVEPWVAKDMLWLAIGLLVIAILFGLWGIKKHDPHVGASQSTTGDGSPAIGSIHGNPTFHYAPTPAAIQDRKDPFGSPTPQPLPSSRKERVMDIHPHVLLASDGRPLPQPDISLEEIIARIYKRLGQNYLPHSNNWLGIEFYDQVDRELANKSLQNQMSVWGHYGKRADQLISMNSLRTGSFDHRKGAFEFPVTDSVHPIVLQGITFNSQQVDAVWPK